VRHSHSTQSLTSLDVCRLTKFVDKVRRWRPPVKTFIHGDGTLESNPLRSNQPVKLVEEWRDVVEPRRRKDIPGMTGFRTDSQYRRKTSVQFSSVTEFMFDALADA